MFSMFLSSYRNTRESLGELEKAVKNSPAVRVPTAFLVLPNFHWSLYLTIRLRARVFYEQDSQRGAAELTIAGRKRGRVV